MDKCSVWRADKWKADEERIFCGCKLKVQFVTVERMARSATARLNADLGADAFQFKVISSLVQSTIKIGFQIGSRLN